MLTNVELATCHPPHLTAATTRGLIDCKGYVADARSMKWDVEIVSLGRTPPMIIVYQKRHRRGLHFRQLELPFVSLVLLWRHLRR